MAGVPSAAKVFRDQGITTLVYDPRTVGESDGQPRNNIDPFRQIQDYSDAITYLSKLPNVDATKIGLWGISLAASVALCTASFDRRAKWVIAACPIVEYCYDKQVMEKVLQRCFQDRSSQVMGNPPFYIPMLNSMGKSPAGLDFGYEEEYAAEMVRRGIQVAPNHKNQTTIQSYHKLAMWSPWPMWKHLGATPALFLVPEIDRLCPPEVQIRHFDSLSGPKRLHVQKGSGHILEKLHADEIFDVSQKFVHDVISGLI